MKSTYRSLFAFVFLLGAFSCTKSTVTDAKSPTAGDPKATVAKIGGAAITAKELDEFAKKDLKKIEQQYQEQAHQIKQQALEMMIDKRLVEAKAKAAGKTVDELMKAEVADKVTLPTPAEIAAFYDQAKARNPNVPAMSPEINGQISKLLTDQKGQAIAQTFYAGLRAEAKVEMLLPAYKAPRVEVKAEGQLKGVANAPITIVEFSDYECPFCSRGEQVIAEVLKAYPGKISLYFRDFPLPMHPNAPKAAEAAHCAGSQGKYWEMHGKLFENQSALKVDQLKGYAKELGLDTAKFDKCLDSGEKAKLVQDGQKAGEELGVNGTPAFFINGIMLSGAQPFEKFKAIIDEELAKK